MSPPIPFWRRLELERLELQVHSSFLVGSNSLGIAPPGVRFANANPKRLAFVFWNNTGGTVAIKPGIFINGPSEGILIQTTTNPFTFTFEDLGPCLTSEWYGHASAIINPFSWIEVFSL